MEGVLEGGTRVRIKWAQVVGLISGIWLMAAPAVEGYTGTGAADLHRITGPLIASFALVALWPATRELRWVNLVLGAITAAGPLLLAHPLRATLVGVITGIGVMAATPAGGPDPDERGNGWAGLFPTRGQKPD